MPAHALRSALDLAALEAMTELRTKSLRAVHVETAIRWCGRAIAARAMGRHDDAREYAHEALEHAALADDSPLLDLVRTSLRARGITLDGPVVVNAR